jgi:PAS domain S-box-containing protein
MAQGKVIGTINVDDNQAEAFGSTQERLLTIAAAQAGVTIENARLFAKISAEQQQTQAIIQHMADGLLLIDSQGIIRTCNFTLTNMLGLNRNQIVGQDVHSAELHPNLASITATSTQLARTGVLAREVSLETPRPRALQVFTTTVVDDYKKPAGEVRLIHDVTKERELEQLKDDFYSTVSHELRTPLFSIQGFAQIMLEEEELDPDTQKEFLDTIRRQATQLSEMVNNLLDLSKFEEGKLVLEKTPLSLLDVINQTILRLQGFARQQKVRLVPNLSPHLPEIIGDKQRLEQVLTNLIGNAIKFSDANDEVTILTAVHEAEILVQVKDNGIGIPAEDLDSIFSRYYQASNKSERSAMGSGLGLHIAKKIAERHGGRIWAESETGRGSTFSFALPLSGEDSN